jgi:hypothetical protein
MRWPEEKRNAAPSIFILIKVMDRRIKKRGSMGLLPLSMKLSGSPRASATRVSLTFPQVRGSPPEVAGPHLLLDAQQLYLEYESAVGWYRAGVT